MLLKDVVSVGLPMLASFLRLLVIRRGFDSLNALTSSSIDSSFSGTVKRFSSSSRSFKLPGKRLMSSDGKGISKLFKVTLER